MKDKTLQRYNEIVQSYVDNMKEMLAKFGDVKIKKSMYGGQTVSEEIKLAEERINERGIQKP